ncbi:MAG: hypothetical protein ABJD07_13180 [Gemmatimonadaceae bacterium]
MPEVIVVPVVFLIPSAVIVLRMYFKHTEKMASLTARAGPSPELDDRMARMEQAVESIAIEMERVGEGQRFLTKLLSERMPPALSAGSPARAGNEITPH